MTGRASGAEEQASPAAPPDEDAAGAPSSFGGHLAALLERRLHALGKSLAAARAERGVDAVHDLRVASRRLRAFGVTFQDLLADKRQARMLRSLRGVAKAVGPLRDRDVQRELLAARAEHAQSELERAGADHLLERLEAERARSSKRAKRRLRRIDVEALSRRVRRAARDVLEQLLPLAGQRAYARALLERLVADAAGRVPGDCSTERADDLHRLRLDIKELRYALELFEPLFGAHFEALYERATELQDTLGAHRDLFVLGEALGAERADLEGRGRHGLAAGVAAVEAALAAERMALFERFRSHGFDAAWWRERLALALDVA